MASDGWFSVHRWLHATTMIDCRYVNCGQTACCNLLNTLHLVRKLAYMVIRLGLKMMHMFVFRSKHYPRHGSVLLILGEQLKLLRVTKTQGGPEISLFASATGKHKAMPMAIIRALSHAANANDQLYNRRLSHYQLVAQAATHSHRIVS